MKEPKNGYYVLEVMDYGGIHYEEGDEVESIRENIRNRSLICGSVNNDGQLGKYPDMPRFDTYEEAKEVMDHWRARHLAEPDAYDTMDIIFDTEVRKKYYICKIEF